MSDTTECRMVTGGEIADELSDAFPDIPTSKARDAFRTILHAMQNALIRGDRIEIRGFGSFAPRYRQGGMRRNPRSGEKVYAPARWVVIFRAGRTCARRSTRARNERPDCVPTIRINETKPLHLAVRGFWLGNRSRVLGTGGSVHYAALAAPIASCLPPLKRRPTQW